MEGFIVEIRFISQYAGDNAHYNVINDLLNSDTFTSFRSLNAFVTLGGLLMIDESLVNYLERGNSLNWIIGIDNGITTKEALEYLRALKEQYDSQIEIKIFTAGSNYHIFHPKSYCLENDNECVLITGSANSTEGGLLGNFELSMLARFDKTEESGINAYQEFEEVWNQYSTPYEPLMKENLLDLMSLEVDRLLEKMETNKQRETGNKTAEKRKSHPMNELSKGNEIIKNIRSKHGSKTGARKRTFKIVDGESDKLPLDADTNETSEVLVMDILTETRRTQVQFPVKAVRIYFSGVTNINLYYREEGKIKLEGIRPIVVLGHNDTVRIELREIKEFSRPLIMRMSAIPGDINNYVYELIDSNHPEFNELDNLLRDYGHQSRAGSRRWLII